MSETPSETGGTTQSKMSQGFDSAKNKMGKVFSTLNGKLPTTSSGFLIGVLCVIFIGASYYMYVKRVKPMLDKKYVPNKEFTKGTTKKQADLYFFYTTWCPHCKKSMPEWNKLKEKIGKRKINNYSIKFLEVDCDKDSKVADKYNVESYPTIKLIYGDTVVEYDAKPELSTLMSFLEKVIV